MKLDIPSLMIMEAFASALAASILLSAWLQDRRVTAVAVWGAGQLSSATGILFVTLGTALHQPAWFGPAGIVLSLAAGLMWNGARLLDAKRPSFVAAFAGAIVTTLIGVLPALRGLAGAIPLMIGVGFFGAAAASIYAARGDRLPARTGLMALLVLHVAVLLIGVVSVLNGSVGDEHAPDILSPFGIIHFESIIFALGSATALLILLKERSVAIALRQARTDGLTGISNRAAFIEGAERIIQRCQRDGEPVAVMMFDLDHFKTINDNHGHAVGDDVIRQFCLSTTSMLRPGDLFGRMGGEEFAVVMAGVSVTAATVRADRIRTAFAETCRTIGGRQVEATVSGGVSVSENGQVPLGVLLEHADIALYRAKAAGRDRVLIAEEPRLARDSNVVRVA